VFTLIHVPPDAQVAGEDTMLVLSDRSVSPSSTLDEAPSQPVRHLRWNMRRAPLNASFMGPSRTGTPLIVEVISHFASSSADYVSTYNFRDAIEDGARPAS